MVRTLSTGWGVTCSWLIVIMSDMDCSDRVIRRGKTKENSGFVRMAVGSYGCRVFDGNTVRFFEDFTIY